MKILKPIRFPRCVADEMIQAIMRGDKTEMRLRPFQMASYYTQSTIYDDDMYLCARFQDLDDSSSDVIIRSPYKIGDVLYVQEAWATKDVAQGSVSKKEYIYRATDDFVEGSIKWNPSVHMTKEAARLFLRVKDVMFEHLQDITDESCMAEGIRKWSRDGKPDRYFLADKEGSHPLWAYDSCFKAPRYAMQYIWNFSLKYYDVCLDGWSANPWVFVVEFERLTESEQGKLILSA